jgi:NAD(P)-dependent dehydrogenase (short-subunit alcohol dehydrogenase family)
MEGAAQRTEAAFGKVHEVCNNAGVNNAGSMAGLIGPLEDKGGIYRVSKFAVVALTANLRTDLASLGIGASVLCPGLIRTNITNSGRNRPGQFGAQAAPETPEEAAWSERFAKAIFGGMDPVAVGEKVLDGIRHDQLYILTRPEWKPFVERRNRKLEAAFGAPDPAAVEALFNTFRWIVRG